MSRNNVIDILNDVLNQHGFIGLVDVVYDMIEREYYRGFNKGYDNGWDDCYDYHNSIVDSEVEEDD